MPAHRLLESLLNVELSGRETRRIATSLKMSGLPLRQILETFAFAFQPAIGRSRIDTLATGAWICSVDTVLMQGPPGVGPGVKAVQLCFSVIYCRFDELMAALRADAAMPPVPQRRRRYMTQSLLIIDEAGFETMTRQEASLFFRVVAERYGRGPMLITTNKAIRDWTELLAGDEVLATAILDRLLRRAHVLTIKGRSYWLRDLEESLRPAET